MRINLFSLINKMLIKINETLLKLKLDLEFTNINLIILEKKENNCIRESIQTTFNKLKKFIILNVTDTDNEIIVIILKLNNQESNLVYFNKQSTVKSLKQNPTPSVQEEFEIKEQLDGIKNLFGGSEMQLSLNEKGSVEEANSVFENFGKGLSSLFSINPEPINKPLPTTLLTTTLLNDKVPLIKNENTKISFNIKKKVI